MFGILIMLTIIGNEVSCRTKKRIPLWYPYSFTSLCKKLAFRYHNALQMGLHRYIQPDNNILRILLHLPYVLFSLR